MDLPDTLPRRLPKLRDAIKAVEVNGLAVHEVICTRDGFRLILTPSEQPTEAANGWGLGQDGNGAH